MNMFDKPLSQLLEESPMIQNMIRKKFEQDRAQLLEQEIEKGKVLALQEILVKVIRAKYPDLGEFTEQQASHFDKPDALERLILQLMSAPDADTARRLLEVGPEM